MTSRFFIIFAVAAAPAPAAATVDGAQLFRARCASCHWDPALEGEKPRQGPSMKGLIGRDAGAHPDFRRYSAGMKAAGFTWTADRLNAYLDNPRKVVPGTSMAFVGLKKPEERRAVVDYLVKFGK
jgi:cytochrome c